MTDVYQPFIKKARIEEYPPNNFTYHRKIIVESFEGTSIQNVITNIAIATNLMNCDMRQYLGPIDAAVKLHLQGDIA